MISDILTPLPGDESTISYWIAMIIGREDVTNLPVPPICSQNALRSIENRNCENISAFGLEDPFDFSNGSYGVQ